MRRERKGEDVRCDVKNLVTEDGCKRVKSRSKVHPIWVWNRLMCRAGMVKGPKLGGMKGQVRDILSDPQLRTLEWNVGGRVRVHAGVVRDVRVTAGGKVRWIITDDCAI